MLRDRIADDILESFVVHHGREVCVVCGDWEGIVVSECSATAPELLLRELFETNDIVFVGDLIHLGMDKE